MVEDAPPPPPAVRTPVVVAASARVVGVAPPEMVPTARRPPAAPFRGLAVFEAGVPQVVVRHVPKTSGSRIATVSGLGRPLVAVLGLVLGGATALDRPARTLAPAVVPRTDKTAVGRVPVSPAPGVTPGLTRRVVVARVAAAPPNAGPVASGGLLGPDARPAAVETTKLVTLAPAVEMPRPVAAAMGRPAATETARVATHPTPPQGVQTGVARLVPGAAVPGGLPPSPFPVLPRKVARKAGRLGRQIAPPVPTGSGRPRLGPGGGQTLLLATGRPGVASRPRLAGRPTARKAVGRPVSGRPPAVMGLRATPRRPGPRRPDTRVGVGLRATYAPVPTAARPAGRRPAAFRPATVAAPARPGTRLPTVGRLRQVTLRPAAPWGE